MFIRGMHDYCFHVYESFLQNEKEITFHRTDTGTRIINRAKHCRLVWMERELGHSIIHAGRGREHQIEGRRVDRYYEIEKWKMRHDLTCCNFMVAFGTDVQRVFK